MIKRFRRNILKRKREENANDYSKYLKDSKYLSRSEASSTESHLGSAQENNQNYLHQVSKSCCSDGLLMDGNNQDYSGLFSSVRYLMSSNPSMKEVSLHKQNNRNIENKTLQLMGMIIVDDQSLNSNFCEEQEELDWKLMYERELYLRIQSETDVSHAFIQLIIIALTNFFVY